MPEKVATPPPRPPKTGWYVEKGKQITPLSLQICEAFNAS